MSGGTYSQSGVSYSHSIKDPIPEIRDRARRCLYECLGTRSRVARQGVVASWVESGLSTKPVSVRQFPYTVRTTLSILALRQQTTYRMMRPPLLLPVIAPPVVPLPRSATPEFMSCVVVGDETRNKWDRATSFQTPGTYKASSVNVAYCTARRGGNADEKRRRGCLSLSLSPGVGKPAARAMASSCAFCFLASLITRKGFVDRCSRYTCYYFRCRPPHRG